MRYPAVKLMDCGKTCTLTKLQTAGPEKILGTVTLCLNGLLNYALVVANTNFHFLKPMLIPRQGDLFLYGTEALICPINRKGSWVGCLGWQRGRARTFFLSIFLRSFFR